MPGSLPNGGCQKPWLRTTTKLFPDVFLKRENHGRVWASLPSHQRKWKDTEADQVFGIVGCDESWRPEADSEMPVKFDARPRAKVSNFSVNVLTNIRAGPQPLLQPDDARELAPVGSPPAYQPAAPLGRSPAADLPT